MNQSLHITKDRFAQIILNYVISSALDVNNRAGLTFRGARGILSARGPLTPPPNGLLNTKLSKIKKYPFVFDALKSFLCIYLQKKKNYTSII